MADEMRWIRCIDGPLHGRNLRVVNSASRIVHVDPATGQHHKYEFHVSDLGEVLRWKPFIGNQATP